MFPVIWFVFSKLSWRKARIFFSYKKMTTTVVYAIFLIFFSLRNVSLIWKLWQQQQSTIIFFAMYHLENIPEGGQNKIQCSNLLSQSKGHKTHEVHL